MLAANIISVVPSSLLMCMYTIDCMVHVNYTAHENRHTHNTTHLAAVKKVLTLQKHTPVLAANIISVVPSLLVLLCMCTIQHMKTGTRTIVHTLQLRRKC